MATYGQFTEAAGPGETSNFQINGRLINPFRGMSPDEMEERIARFMVTTSITDTSPDLIRKAAYLAQDNTALDRNRSDGLKLESAEKDALYQERHHHWNQPWTLFALVACCSLGACVQGWDETAVNQAQALHHWNVDLGIKDHGHQLTPSLRMGLVNSAPYLCCAILGCWLSDPLNRFFGRRGTIFIACAISCITCVWQAFTNSWWHMFIARFALGLGIGPKSSTTPVYAAECAPKEIRGGLVMMWQMWVAFGIMLGYVAGVALQGVDGSIRWRLIIGSPMVFPLIVCAYVFFLPESPRWLLQKGRRTGKKIYFQRAFESFSRLRRNKLQAARDLFLVYHVLEEEEQIRREHNRFFELWTTDRNRRALVASLICMFFQQFCGVNVMAYYSTLILKRAGFKIRQALLCSLGFGIINFVFAIPAVPLIDKFGRRGLLLVTFPFMAIFQLMTGLAFTAKDELTRKVLVVLGMYLFSVAYSPGEGPVPFVYASESMPLYVRDLGTAHAVAVTWLFNFLLAITFPSFLESFGEIGSFAYYAGWCVIGWILILLFVYETKGKTLEELDATFSIPSRTHAKHSLAVFRYHLKRWALLDKNVQKPILDFTIRDAGNGSIESDEDELRMIPMKNPYA